MAFGSCGLCDERIFVPSSSISSHWLHFLVATPKKTHGGLGSRGIVLQQLATCDDKEVVHWTGCIESCNVGVGATLPWEDKWWGNRSCDCPFLGELLL